MSVRESVPLSRGMDFTELPVDRRPHGAAVWSSTCRTFPARVASLGQDADARNRDAVSALVATLVALLDRMTFGETVTLGLTTRVVDVLLRRPPSAEPCGVQILEVAVERNASRRDIEAAVATALAAAADAGQDDASTALLPIVVDGQSSGPQVARPSGVDATQLLVSFVIESDAVTIDIAYDGALFELVTINQFLEHCGRLLAAAIAEPGAPMAQFPLLTSDERAQAIHQWNETRVARPETQLVHELFERQVTRSPSAIAARSDEGMLTYHELNRRADLLARVLALRGVGAETMVGLCVTRSLNLLVAMLAILKAGGAFVPLDPELPESRLAFMLRNTAAAVVLVDAETDARIAEVGPWAERIRVDLAPADVAVVPLRSRCAPESLAYVIYTSGSTGSPKGVLLTHRALCNHAQWFAGAVGMTASDRVLLHASISFDAAMAEIFPPLLSGAMVALAHADAHHELSEIPRIASRSGVTVMQLVPSALRVLVMSPDFESCSDLRFLVCGGEALDARLCNAVRAVLPSVRIGNFYGPSEATVDATNFVCGTELPDTGPIPIGRPIANAICHVLDDDLEPLPIGWIGELYLGGDGIARGYLNQPELTAQRFIPDPFRPGARLYRTGDRARYLVDGNLVYAGRVDAQVKVRGYRIELGEVEQALTRIEGVAHAAVMARDDRDGDTQLVAYIVPVSGTPFDAISTRSALLHVLPAWMVPGMFVPLERLPLTINGKLDLRALPEPVDASVDVRPDPLFADPVERSLLDIWRRTLSIDTLGPDDDFFALGGHSLKVFRLLAEIERHFGVSLRATSVFGSATIRTLAAKIRAEQDREVWTV